MYFLFLYFAISLNLSTAFAQDYVQIWHDRALAIQAETKTQMSLEMEVLFNRWAKLAPKTTTEIAPLIIKVKQKIYADKERVKELLEQIKALPQPQNEEVGLDLTSNGQKFAGTYSDNILEKISGQYLPIVKGNKLTGLSQVQMTEVKMLLLYLIGIMEGIEDVTQSSVFDQIQFLYGYEFEPFIQTSSIESSFLYSNNVFYMPNSGYVFGGTLRNGVNRGMDCSAFISMVLESDYRPSSLLLEVLWNQQMKIPMPYFDANPDKLKDLIDNWYLIELGQEFQAIMVRSSSDLQAGDVVVWRTSTKDQPDIFAKSGHVLMVLAPGPGLNKFLGIDLRRDDDQEGHYQDVYHLFLPGKETYVVRKRTP